MQLRTLALAEITAAIALVAGGYLGGVEPLLVAGARQSEEEIADSAARLDQAKPPATVAPEAPETRAQRRQAERDFEIRELESQRDLLDERNRSLVESIPDLDEKLRTEATELRARLASVLAPEGMGAYLERLTRPPADASGFAIGEVAELESVAGEFLSDRGFSLKGQGRYADLVRYLAALEGSHPRTRVVSVGIAVSSRDDSAIDFSIELRVLAGRKASGLAAPEEER